MKQITVNGKTLDYEIVYTNKKGLSITVKENIVLVTAPFDISDKMIVSQIRNQFLNLYYKIHPEAQNKTVHYKGNKYNVILKKGKKDFVNVIDDNIIITAVKDELRYYQVVLRRFYKKTIEEELVNLMYDAQNDFKEVVFPKIKILYMTTYFGRYFKNDNLIKISSMLGKYDPIFVKVILYHELCHTLEMKHNTNFFELLELKYPGAVKLDNILKYDHYNDYL